MLFLSIYDANQNKRSKSEWLLRDRAKSLEERDQIPVFAYIILRENNDYNIII